MERAAEFLAQSIIIEKKRIQTVRAEPLQDEILKPNKKLDQMALELYKEKTEQTVSEAAVAGLLLRLFGQANIDKDIGRGIN